MKTMIRVVIAVAALLLGTSATEAQRGPTTAPTGDVLSSSSNCQVVHQEAVAQINAQHSQDWPACRGASTCLRAANAKKADALKAEGEKLRLCQASRTAEPPVVLRPLPIPTVAPGFKPGRPGTWKPQDVTWNGKKWAVYTDPKGQPWRFATRFVDDSPAATTWVLHRNTVKPDGTHLGQKVPTASYKREEYNGEGRLTSMTTEKPGYQVDNFPYAR